MSSEAGAVMSLQIIRYLSFVTFAVYFYDYMLTLSMEVDRIWRRRLSVTSLLFLFLRYTTPIEMVISLSIFVPLFPASWVRRKGLPGRAVYSKNRCRGLIRAGSLLNILHLFLVACIVSLRTFALSGRNKNVLVLLLSSLICQPVVMLVLSLQTKILVMGGFCITVGRNNSNNYITIFWWYPLIMDTLVFISTVYYIRRRRDETGQQCSISNAIMKDGTLYFVVICLINMTNLIFFRTLQSPFNLIGFNCGFVFTAVLTFRFTLNLQGLGDARDGEEFKIHPSSYESSPGTYTTAIPTVGSYPHPPLQKTNAATPHLSFIGPVQEGIGGAIEMSEMVHQWYIQAVKKEFQGSCAVDGGDD